MRLQKSVYLLSFLLLVVFTADLNGQFRRKKVKLSETNKIEEFINDHIQDPFMIEHIQSIQSELVKMGFEILPPETDGQLAVEIVFEDFNFDPYYGSTEDPITSHIILRNPKKTKEVSFVSFTTVLKRIIDSAPTRANALARLLPITIIVIVLNQLTIS